MTATPYGERVLARAKERGLPELVLYWDETRSVSGVREENGRILLVSGQRLLWSAEAPIGSMLPPLETICDDRVARPSPAALVPARGRSRRARESKGPRVDGSAER